MIAANPGARLLCGITMTIAMLAAGCANPPLEPLRAGALFALAESEGLLIVHIDAEVPLERISLDRGVVSGALGSGQHVWLVRVPSGAYRWTEVAVGSQSGVAQIFRFDSGDEGVAFEIEAGQINYPGELVIRADAGSRSVKGSLRVRNRNHAAKAVRTLLEQAPDLLAAYPLRNAGWSDDGFLDLYSRQRQHQRKERARSASSDPAREQTPSRAGHSAAVLFSEDGIKDVLVSPTGRWILAHAVRGRVHGLLVQGGSMSTPRPAFSTANRLHQAVWVGKDRYLAVFDTPAGGVRRLLGRIVETGGRIDFEHEWIDAPGRLVHPLPLIDDVVMWRFDTEELSRVHRVRLDELVRFREESRGRGLSRTVGESVASIRGSADRWIVDRRGHPRAVSRRDERGFTILTRSDGAGFFREIYSFEDSDEAGSVFPLALTADGARLVVGAYGGGNTMGLFELDMETGRIGERLFVRDDVDVSDALVDAITGELIAAVYTEGGERRFHYVESYAGPSLESLGDVFSKDAVAVLSRNMSRDVFVVAVTGPTNPGTYHLIDTSKGASFEIGQTSARLEPEQLVEVETIAIESRDGTPIEAFLTLPGNRDPEGAPLIVHPHGGPIGVQDTKEYDALVQYLASWGFAILQVNYRGSSGYGRSFREAGKQQWSRGIEDDIDVAVERVMSRREIDGSRMCIMGGSYGGYSAVASVVRHEGRYRCAATLNGVTDIPLMFEESDCADIATCIDSLKEIIGDPETERARLIEASPAYRVEEIQTPVFVAYGTEDRRVDPDHSHRLILMLEALSREHEILEIRGAEHGLTRKEWAIYARSLRRFLTRHLFPDAVFVPDSVVRIERPSKSIEAVASTPRGSFIDWVALGRTDPFRRRDGRRCRRPGRGCRDPRVDLR